MGANAILQARLDVLVKTGETTSQLAPATVLQNQMIAT